MYTDIRSVIRDATLYGIAKTGGTLTLDLFSQLAKNRWQWIVDNWVYLRENIKEFEQGEKSNIDLFNDFEREIEATRAGSRINPFDSIDKFNKYHLILAQISVEDLKPSDPEEANVQDVVFSASNIDEEGFRSMLSFIKSYMISIEQEIGLSDPTMNDIYGVNSGRKQRNPSITDLEKLDSLQGLYEIVEGYIFDQQRTTQKPPNLLQFNQESLTEDSGIDVVQSYMTYVPVPFEISLESMAQKYLGSSDRWMELVTVNNLKSPYVDNVGKKFYLSAPASFNTATISNELRNEIAPGVRIGIGSERFMEDTRVIERIRDNGTTMTLILSGKNDLSKILPKERGYVKIYKPATVRNNSFILIPSETVSAIVTKKTSNREDIRSLDRAFIEFGVDVRRDERTRDIVLDQSGNFAYAYGFPAVRQAVMNALRTRSGELPFHPNYGVNFDVGDNFFGSVDEAVVFADIITDALLADRRYADVRIADVSATPTGVSMKILVKIKGFGQYIPLAFVS